MAAGRSNVSCLLITNPSEGRALEARGVMRTQVQSARAIQGSACENLLGRTTPILRILSLRFRFSALPARDETSTEFSLLHFCSNGMAGRRN
jgi:hypothetical protein